MPVQSRFLVTVLGVMLAFGCDGEKRRPAIPPSGQPENSATAGGNAIATPPSPPGSGVSGQRTGETRSYDVVLRVGDVPVTVQELKDLLDNFTPHGQNVARLDESGKQTILTELVARNHLYIEGRRQGLESSFSVRLKEKSVGDQWTGHYYAYSHLSRRVKVPDEEVRKRLPPVMEWATVREIVVTSMGEAEEVLKELAAGKSFAELAKEKSVSPSASKGGMLPMQFRRGFPELYDRSVEEKFFTVAAGEVIPVPLATPMGYGLFRVEERNQFSAKQKEQIVRSVRGDIYNEMMGSLVRNIQEMYPLHIIEGNLEKAAADPIGHLEMPVARVGKNEIRFGEVYSYAESTAKGLKDLRKFNVAQWVSALKGQYGNLAFREAAVDEGLLEDPLVKENLERFRKMLVVEKVRENLSKKTSVKEEDVLRRYEEMKPQWRKTNIYTVSMVQMPSRKEAEDAAGRLRSRESLQGLIPMTSHGGGDVQLPKTVMREEQVPAVFRPTLLKMREGEVSGPIQMVNDGIPGGFVVLRLDKVEKGRIPSLGEVHAELETMVRQGQVQLRTTEIVVRSAKQYPVRDFQKDLFDKAIAEWEAEKQKAKDARS